MKKVSTAATQQSRNMSQQRLTIGLDLGDHVDRRSNNPDDLYSWMVRLGHKLGPVNRMFQQLAEVAPYSV